MNKLSRKEFIIRMVIVALLVLAVMNFSNVGHFISQFFTIFLPFILGLGIAYIWNLVMRFIERNVFDRINKPWADKIKRPISIILSLLIILFVIVIVFYLVVPQLYNSINLLIQNASKLVENIYVWVEENPSDSELIQNIKDYVAEQAENWPQMQENIIEYVRTNIGGFFGSTFDIINSVLGHFITAVTAIIFSVYLLSSKETIGSHFRKLIKTYLPKKYSDGVFYVTEILNDKYASFFKGQMLDAVIIGFILYLVLLVTGMPYAMTISVVVAVTALIPMIGAFIGGAIGFIMIAANNINQGFIFLLILVLVQQLEGDFIYPKLVGDSIGLPGIWTFSAVILGGALGGPIAMLLFVPFVAAMYQILRNDMKRRNLKEKSELI